MNMCMRSFEQSRPGEKRAPTSQLAARRLRNGLLVQLAQSWSLLVTQWRWREAGAHPTKRHAAAVLQSIRLTADRWPAAGRKTATRTRSTNDGDDQCSNTHKQAESREGGSVSSCQMHHRCARGSVVLQFLLLVAVSSDAWR